MDTDSGERPGPDLSISAHRWRALRPFAAVALLAVVVGGLVAALTGPLSWPDGSWAAAYLVLVVGVAQLVLAAGRIWLPEHLTARRSRLWAELAAWNLGSLAVLAGTMGESVWAVALGSLLLLAALASWAEAARRPRHGHRTVAAGYLLFLAFLILSVLVGTAISVSRHA
ncbi:MAG: hypothetical protein Q4P07_05830 [Ornithinimicrobium sp.]|uniref:hypothetical protein n=1 Tax=Ornithinimicrobium sp. TaxID=1977084 RepID=UPI0026E027AB|nr:hypothetical protein [Ornithinimicrobium sp.]MDO5739650.1 hypothetical protein [Ornithinimicrobium sp.]